MTLCEVFSYYLCLQSPDMVVIGDRGSGEAGETGETGPGLLCLSYYLNINQK